MVKEKKKGKAREIKHSHALHAILPITFTAIWMVDTRLLNLTDFLNNYVPIIVRLILFIIILTFAILLMYLSHKILFKEHGPSKTLITEGILQYVRNPLYLSIQLIYVSLLFLSISLISIIVFILIAFVYNKMVNYEESILEEMFGAEYLIYKKKVPKWIPKLSKI